MLKNAHCTENPRQATARLSRPRRRARYIWWLCCGILGLLLQTASAQSPSDDEASPITPDVSEQQPETPVYQSPEERDMKLLQQQLDSQSIVWLEAMGQPFMSLFEPELTGSALGALLIINAEGQHSHWPATSQAVRSYLPNFGWNTLSTDLPEPEPLPLPARTMELPVQNTGEVAPDESPPPATDPDAGELATDDNAREPMPLEQPQQASELKIPVEDIALERIRSAMEFLQEKGQFNIAVLGLGTGAVRATHYLNSVGNLSSEETPRLIRALILVNARNYIDGADLHLRELMQTPNIPILDLYTDQTYRDQKEAEERLLWAKRARYEKYIQVRLPPQVAAMSANDNLLARRVRGFLDKYAKGVEVENAIISR